MLQISDKLSKKGKELASEGSLAKRKNVTCKALRLKLP